MAIRWRLLRLMIICILVTLSFIELYQHTSNRFLDPKTTILSATSELASCSSQSPSTNQRYSPNLHSNAYVFYATEDAYACSALVNIERLQTMFNTQHRIIVLVSNSVSEPMRMAIVERNATVIEQEVPPLADAHISYYEDVLLKLIAFKLHIIDPSLQRILVLDADQLILKNLDYLFELPDTDIAAPRAYWISRDFVSSTFMLVMLSGRLWQCVTEGMDYIAPNTYDMDLINAIFGDIVMVLPGHLVTLNSHWESWTVPSWFRDIESSEDFKPPNKSETGKKLEKKLIALYDQASILHYSALGKPWSDAAQNAKHRRPEAHPLFFDQFTVWREAAQQICPGYQDDFP